MTAGSPGRQVLTEVRATVDPARQGDLVAGFEALLAAPPPEGLLRAELLHLAADWRIQTLWRDRDALMAMRAGTAEPAAPQLFRSVGADPELTIMEVRASTQA